MQTSRRSFLKRSAAAALLTPYLLPSQRLVGRGQAQLAADDGLHRHGHAVPRPAGRIPGQRRPRCWPSATWTPTAARTPSSASTSSTASKEAKRGCAAYNDFREIIHRKDIDAVCIATPDHWHAFITLAALRAGKDVYCEKPLTHNIHEAIEVLRAVDANRRVLQTGSMQRSMKEFRVACELVRNGCIGKIQRVECSFGDPAVPCDLPEEQAGAGAGLGLLARSGPGAALQLGPQPARPAQAFPALAELSRVRRRRGHRLGRPSSRYRPVGTGHGRTAARGNPAAAQGPATSAGRSWSMPTA